MGRGARGGDVKKYSAGRGVGDVGTVFIANRLANRHRGLLVGVLQDHDFGQFDTKTGTPVSGVRSMVCVAWWEGSVLVCYQLRQLGMAVAGQQLDRVCRHGWRSDYSVTAS